MSRYKRALHSLTSGINLALNEKAIKTTTNYPITNDITISAGEGKGLKVDVSLWGRGLFNKAALTNFYQHRLYGLGVKLQTPTTIIEFPAPSQTTKKCSSEGISVYFFRSISIGTGISSPQALLSHILFAVGKISFSSSIICRFLKGPWLMMALH